MHPAPSQTLRATIVTLLLALPATLFAQQAKLTAAAAPTPETHALKATRPRPAHRHRLRRRLHQRTSAVHGEIALAHHLRENTAPLIHSEIFENHHGNEAHREILRLLAASNPIPASQPA